MISLTFPKKTNSNARKDENRYFLLMKVRSRIDPKTRSLILYDVNMNCIKSMNEAHKSIRRESISIDNTHINTTS